MAQELRRAGIAGILAVAIAFVTLQGRPVAAMDRDRATERARPFSTAVDLGEHAADRVALRTRASLEEAQFHLNQALLVARYPVLYVEHPAALAAHRR
jgi:hypothetical protein